MHVTFKGLILDFGGVVTTDFYGALGAFSERAGLDRGAFVRALRDDPEGREAFHAVERGAIPQREFEITVGRILGLPDDGLLAAALADIRPRPEVIDLIKRARASGVLVAALSNSWGAGAYNPDSGWDLNSIFDAVVISDRIGMRKPEPGIYLLTAERLGLPPAECVFVDDTERYLPDAAALVSGLFICT